MGCNITSMKCEICGKEAKLKRVMVESVEMMVCHECSKYGIVLPEKRRVKPVLKKKSIPYSKDVFEEMTVEIVPEWGRKIREAREKKGMSREELGAKVGEKTSTIAKIENEDLRPPDKTVKKIEKVLEIKLFQKVEKEIVKHREAKPLTLGDLLKNEK
ncbi:MAG TPA: TIGR00270 family protein [Thermoplasmatales archaeon]|nr:TIGR00270 family protein [Thermoplasmatales archaeon]